MTFPLPESWFAKVQALGNDFVWLLRGADSAFLSLAQRYATGICDRHWGIGADGVILWNGSSDHPEVWFLNADGSSAEVCGNGLRALAMAGRELGVFPPDLQCFYSGGASFPVAFRGGDSHPAVGLGIPRLVQCPDLDEAMRTGRWSGSLVYMPNPHIVVFDAPASCDRSRVAETLTRCVPRGANVGFASVEDGVVELRVWERGVGWTLACGSGAAAAVVVAHMRGAAKDGAVTVRQPGGDLKVWVDESGRPWIEGGASLVYVGFMGGVPRGVETWEESIGRGSVRTVTGNVPGGPTEFVA